MMNYPYDIVSIVRKKTFSVEARFSRKTDDNPLQIFDRFSRFVFTAIQDKEAVTANIHVEDLEEITQNTLLAKKKAFDLQYKPSQAGDMPQSPAYTMRFTTGRLLKGKTPVEVLRENPENGKQMLNDQYKWLKSNLEKFPNNKKMMDAIAEAAKIDPEELAKVSDSPASLPPMSIMNIGCRPLIRKKRESDGFCRCYEANVTWDVTRTYPVTVTISNYYAPVEKKDDGTINVKLSEKDRSSEQKIDINLTSADWLHTVKQMNLSREAFYMMHAADAFRLADHADMESREAARNRAADQMGGAE